MRTGQLDVFPIVFALCVFLLGNVISILAKHGEVFAIVEVVFAVMATSTIMILRR